MTEKVLAIQEVRIEHWSTLVNICVRIPGATLVNKSSTATHVFATPRFFAEPSKSGPIEAPNFPILPIVGLPLEGVVLVPVIGNPDGAVASMFEDLGDPRGCDVRDQPGTAFKCSREALNQNTPNSFCGASLLACFRL